MESSSAAGRQQVPSARSAQEGDPAITEKRPIYVFIDESGNFDFSPRGTGHFVMAAVIAGEPVASSGALQRLKYELLAEGVDLPHFHGSEDRQFVRDRVLEAINCLSGIEARVFFIDKRRAGSTVHDPVGTYSLFGRAIAQSLLDGPPDEEGGQVVVVFDKALTHKHENAFLAEIKPALAAVSRPYRIYFQSVKFDFTAQIADYVAWATYVSLERNEHRPLAALDRMSITRVDLLAQQRDEEA